MSSSTSSPSKGSWVQFGEDEADDGGNGNGNSNADSESKRGSLPSSPAKSGAASDSGVSSARGSVNSIKERQQQQQQQQDATIDVTQVQVGRF